MGKLAHVITQYIYIHNFYQCSRCSHCYCILKVEETDERIDMEKLKIREKIHFFGDIMLFEDELADNGRSVLSIKIVSFYLISFFIPSLT